MSVLPCPLFVIEASHQLRSDDEREDGGRRGGGVTVVVPVMCSRVTHGHGSMRSARLLLDGWSDRGGTTVAPHFVC